MQPLIAPLVDVNSKVRHEFHVQLMIIKARLRENRWLAPSRVSIRNSLSLALPASAVVNVRDELCQDRLLVLASLQHAHYHGCEAPDALHDLRNANRHRNPV